MVLRKPKNLNVKQTLTDPLFGNCLQTCLAKTLGKPLEHVPNFMLYEHHWWMSMVIYLGIHSYVPTYSEGEVPPNDGKEYITSLKFKVHGKGISHAVIMVDGDVTFDPWPNINYKYSDSVICGYYNIKYTPKS